MGEIKLKTKRLYFKEFDLQLLYSLHSNSEVAKSTIDGIQSLDAVKKHLDEFIDHQEKFGFSQWAVFENESNTFIGRAGLTKRVLNKKTGEQVEIRFAFLPEFWGFGFASEASEALIKFAKEELKLEKLAAANSLTNEKSAKILIKYGFKHITNIIPDGYGTNDEIRYWELNFNN